MLHNKEGQVEWMGDSIDVPPRKNQKGDPFLGVIRIPQTVGIPQSGGFHGKGKCELCRLPAFCLNHSGDLSWPIESRDLLVTLAQERACALQTPNRNSISLDSPVQTLTLRSRDSVDVTFQNFSGKSFWAADILNMNHKAPFHADDLFGESHAMHAHGVSQVKKYVSHIPHFLDLYFFDIWRSITAFSIACGRNGRTGAGLVGRNGASREEENLSCEDLRETVLVADKKRREAVEWFTGFYRLIARVYPEVQFLDISSQDFFPNEGQGEVCFASGWVQSCMTPHPAPFLADFYSRAHPVFEKEFVPPHGRKGGSSASKQPVLHIGFLSRVDKRILLNVAEVTKEIAEELGTDFELIFREFTFESKSFKEQISIVHSMDILIAAHGAGITNAIFMAKGTLLIEVTVFGYHSYTFAHFAHVQELHYLAVMALPDPLAKECLKHVAGAGMPALRAWEATEMQSFEEQKEVNMASPSGEHASGVRTCLRSQNLTIPRNEFASIRRMVREVSIKEDT